MDNIKEINNLPLDIQVGLHNKAKFCQGCGKLLYPGGISQDFCNYCIDSGKVNTNYAIG